MLLAGRRGRSCGPAFASAKVHCQDWIVDMAQLTRGQRAAFNIYIEEYNRFDLELSLMILSTYEALAGPNGTQADGQDLLFELIRVHESDPQGVLIQMREDHNPLVINPFNFLLGLRGWIETHGPAPE